MTPLVTVAAPPDGVEVWIEGTFPGRRRGYAIGGGWFESVDGPDPPVGAVTSWNLIVEQSAFEPAI